MDLQRVHKDKESSNVESLHNCLGLRASQGVGFRYTTQYEAKKLGLSATPKILTMAAWKWLPAVKKGGRKINAVVKEWRPAFCACGTVLSEPHPSGELTDFRIR